jgi:Putative transmembrane protein (PGPGW)
MPEWLSEHAPRWAVPALRVVFEPRVLEALGIVSVASVVLSVALVPWLVCRLPADYFARSEPPEPRSSTPMAGRIARNVLGATLIALGSLMLILPGQGLLTVAAGLVLSEFPGKYRLERKLLGFAPVLHAINLIRRRRGKAPLVIADR